LVDNGVPVLSCVYHPQLERLYHGVAGGGAHLNGNRLMMTAETELKAARVMGAANLIKRLERHGMENTPTHDTALLARMAMVAGGELEAAVSPSPKYDWDLAAGALLVTESGGLVTGLDGLPYRFNQESRQQAGLVAANAARHKAILKILETA
jgi:myo-inositol-1(or 4)-monophosphatase